MSIILCLKEGKCPHLIHLHYTHANKPGSLNNVLNIQPDGSENIFPNSLLCFIQANADSPTTNTKISFYKTCPQKLKEIHKSTIQSHFVSQFTTKRHMQIKFLRLTRKTCSVVKQMKRVLLVCG